MSRFKQYLVLGGLLWAMQSPFVSGILHDGRLQTALLVIIILLLSVAVGLVVWVRRKAVKSKGKKTDDTYPLM